MGVITRVAGTGTPGNSGDDGPATDARLNSPASVAVTADGGFLIADAAGNSGDDGPATDARLNSPAGVAVTADGGFLITDGGTVVRKVSAG